jgi:hypothetical protein
MKLILAVLSMVCAQALATPSLADKTLRLGISGHGNNVEIRAIDLPSRKPHIAPGSSIETLHSIYFTLECFVNTDCETLKAPDEQQSAIIDPEDLVPILKEEGETLLGPFADLIRTSDKITFQIDWSMIKVPFDLLYFQDKPIFASKKISFTFRNLKGEAGKPPGPGWVGLLVSDETADPQRAIFAIEKSFPRSRSFDIADFSLSKLSEFGAVDFVAISGHGHVDGFGDGHIALDGSEKLHSASLVNLRPRLVYFDSCNLGISTSHLKMLQDNGTIYAVAPILSNEAGDSSTATIDIFFSGLAKGANPVSAMFFARSELYERYATDDVRTMLWRSFPFRVYRLN